MGMQATAAGATKIEYRDVSFRLERMDYFYNLDLQIRAGETFVFYSVGNSGKSFLLRFLIGLVRPTLGQVLIDGHDIGQFEAEELYAFRQRVRFVSRDSDLINNLNVFNNIALSLDFHTSISTRELEQEVESIIEDLHLDYYKHEYPINLYENIKKRVALARALIATPEILLMDECAYGYDEITAKSTVALLFDVIKKRYRDRTLTTVIATSDLDLYRPYADRIGVLFNRELIFAGTGAELERTDNPVLRQMVNGDPNLIKINKEYFTYGSI